MATCVLPAYSDTPSPEAGPSAVPSPPTYSFQPTADEETVAFTPRAGVTIPHGHFIRQWPQATLILKDQDPEARLPTYGRGGRIIGELGLTNPDKIDRVTIKLTGQMSLSVADSGSSCATLCSVSQVLWKIPHEQNQNSAGEQHNKCPSILPIHIQFPQSFNSEGKVWRLPPSFEATFLGIPALFVRCLYTLCITITRTRSYHLASWTTNKTYMTMVAFRPRTRPNRPIVLLDTVFASIKPVPEEWMQVVATMHVRPRPQAVEIKPIECHLFLPSIQTFALSDTIPFHITLCSSVRSLRELLPPDCALMQTSAGQRVLSKAEEFRMLIADAPVRVTIARQVIVDVNGQRRVRTFPCGIGKLWAVPPGAGAEHASAAWGASVSTSVSGSGSGGAGAGRDPRAAGANAKAEKRASAKPGVGMFSGSGRRANSSDTVDADCVDLDAEVCLDWQGEIKPWAEVTSGGFSTSNLIVKDFLVLALAPPNPRTSPLIPLQVSHPIRLVTDSWIDTDVLHPGDR